MTSTLPEWCTQEWEMHHARSVAYRFHSVNVRREYWPWQHFIYPAWRGVREIVDRFPEDQNEAESLAHVAAYRRCIDEFRNLTDARSKKRNRVATCSLDEMREEKCQAGSELDVLAYTDQPTARERLADLWRETRTDRRHITMRARVWLYLWAVEGMTQEQIAKASGVKPITVGTTIYRARQQINPDDE